MCFVRLVVVEAVVRISQPEAVVRKLALRGFNIDASQQSGAKGFPSSARNIMGAKRLRAWDESRETRDEGGDEEEERRLFGI